jgi:eukaryotic-like serine/threonine-protein kinase
MTVTSSECRGSNVIIERAVQVTSTELLWVQVRGDDEATARDVLDSVRTHLVF